jgi:4-hydroxybenzoyl-CoA reductase subunit beta
LHLDPFELHRPTSVEEAIHLFQGQSGGADYLAGGTDLLPNYKMHLNLKPHLVALWDIPELSRHDAHHLGAMTRLADLERDADWAARYPVVGDAVKEIATPLVRASGTVGGNLLLETRCFFFNQSYFWRASLGFCLKADGDRCHVVPQKERCYATYSGDLAPALMSLDARAQIAGASGRRSVPLAEVYDRGGDGIKRTHLIPGEILTGIDVPPGSAGASSAYLKLRIRPSFDFPELGVAAVVRGDRDHVEGLRLAMGGVEMAPRCFDDLTASVVGSSLGEDRLRQLSEEVRAAVRPVHNTFLPPDYRRKMVAVFVRRAIEKAFGRGRPAG